MSLQQSLTLLSSAGIGNGAWIAIPEGLDRRALKWQANLDGTFGGTTVTIEIRPVAGTGNPFPLSGYSKTAADSELVEFKAAEVRGVVTGGTSPSINLTLD